MSRRFAPEAASVSDTAQRSAALRRIASLEVPSDEGFAALARLAALACETPMALAALIELERVWYMAVHGMNAGDIPAHHGFHNEVAGSGQVLEVHDTRRDVRFSASEWVTGPLGIRYCAAAPIVFEEATIGTLCVLDRKPRELSAKSLQALVEMATLAGVMLRARIEAFAMLSGH